jgi:hypothetical protein
MTPILALLMLVNAKQANYPTKTQQSLQPKANNDIDIQKIPALYFLK